MSPLIWIQPAHLGGLFFAPNFQRPSETTKPVGGWMTAPVIVVNFERFIFKTERPVFANRPFSRMTANCRLHSEVA
jgi:hypothetical protein